MKTRYLVAYKNIMTKAPYVVFIEAETFGNCEILFYESYSKTFYAIIQITVAA